MKVVVDTNVLVSAILSPLGIPAHILDFILSRRITLLVTALILAEYNEVLHRKEFSFNEKTIKNLFRIIQLNAEQVLAIKVSRKIPDPDDQIFLDCAMTGSAHFLITGNKKHFPSHLCYPIKVVSPAEFLTKIRLATS